MEITSKSFSEFVEDQKTNFCIVVLGAGEPFEEWVKGINGELSESSITDAKECFQRAYTLSDNALGKEGRTDLVLVLDPSVKVDMGKMAIWRLGWGGTIGWAEDFIANHSEDYSSASVESEPSKPEVQLTGQDGNVFSVIGCVTKALKKAGQEQQAKEFTDRAFNAGSYDEVLRLCMEYCEVS